MSGDDHPGIAVLFAPAHRTQPRLQPPMVALDPMSAYRSVRRQDAGSNSSSTAGYTGALSVMTSAGAIFVVPIACSRKRWPALVSRHEET
jgi:hypothetical protein